MNKKILSSLLISIALSISSLGAEELTSQEMYEMERFNSAMQSVCSCTEQAVKNKSMNQMKRCRKKMLNIITDKKTGVVHTTKCGGAGKCGFGGKDSRKNRTTKCGSK